MRFDLVSFGDNGRPFIHHTSEAELREGLAAYAHGYGWRVFQEFQVKGWGRIDLLLMHGSDAWIIELKRSIETPSALRKGLAQVHGYAAAFDAQYDATVERSILCTRSFPSWAERTAEVAYPAVELVTVADLMGSIDLLADAEDEARARLSAAEHEVAVRRGLLDDPSRAVADTGGVVTPEPVVLD